jgi:hypothetical protein
VVFVAYVAFGFLAVPLIVRHVVVPRIGSQLNGSAAITRAAFNPFTFGIRLEDLAVADDAGRTLLGFQRFEGDLRLLATVFRSGYHFGPALLHEPMVRGDIAEDGSINLVTLFEPMLQQLEGEPAWRLPRVVVHELAVTDGRLEFSDVSLIEPFGLTMQGLQFTVEGLDTHPDHDNVHRLTASTASGAQVTWEGVIRVDPFTSRGTIRVTDLPLAQASPYVHTLTEGQVEGGRMAAELEYEFAPAAEPRVALVRVGEARIVELAVTRDQDPLLDVDQFVLTDVRLDAHSRVVEVAGIATTGTRLRIRREPSGQLDIQSLIRSDANATVDPGTLDATPVGTPAALAGDKGPISIAIDATRRLLEETRQTWTVRVEQMSVTDYAADVTDYGRVPPVELSLNMNRLLANDFGMTTGDRTIVIEDLTVVAPDVRATLPLLPRDPAPADAGEVDAEPEDDAEQDGAVALRDESVDPPATIDLDALRLEARGISTGGGAIPFTLASSLQGSGRLEVTGDVDPFRDAAAARASVRMSGVPVKPFEPLTGPYLGYGVETGRMGVVFPVTLQGSRIEGDLEFTFDGLKLGDKVDSPHAPDAPIKLGLDLLRDGNDRIEGTLPIEGDMTDPNFSISGLVADAFVGFIGGIATAPFKLLGSLFGGSEDVDISRVEFEPGSAVLSGEALSNLDVLAQALLERPALTLAATGRYDLERDEPVVRELLLEERILELIHERTTLIETVNEEAYASWVRRLYEVDIGPAYDDVGTPLTVEQMGATLRAAAEVSPKRRAALARERAEAVIDVLVRENGVPAERVTAIVADGDQVLADSPRVDFALE